MLSGVLLAIGGALASAQESAGPASRDLFVTVGKSLVVESPVTIQRVSVGDLNKAEAIPVSPREVLVNGKAPGETSLIVWQQGGNRLLFDLRVRPSTDRLDAVRRELQKEMPGQDVAMTLEDGNVYLRGTVKDMVSAERAVAIASTLGKPVNLLRVNVPGMEQQILLKVKFANIDRSASQELGANLFSTGALNTIGSVTTGQFSPPTVGGLDSGAFSLTDALNIFLFRPDLNFGATIRAMQSKRLLEILAEPNVLAINGKPASFLAGGEFPVPIVQSTTTAAVTIQWREFGIRLSFLPTVTPRGTIRLQVQPEVSSLDLANAVSLSGFVIPAISSRKVSTEIELQDGQSFAIAGLLDNRAVDQLSKVPGLGDIPLLGKIFQSRSISRNNTELLVVVTPEIVQPAPPNVQIATPQMPVPFLKDAPTVPPRTPPVSVTGQAPVRSAQETIPVEQLESMEKQTPTNQPMPVIQYVPIMMPQGQQSAPAAAPTSPAPPASGAPNSR
jgi:pilus assembly protein CpaC